tara:strand:+ start:30939 stop:31805 length:867 start_codon:yes stop_codon:yes gene_type:complete
MSAKLSKFRQYCWQYLFVLIVGIAGFIYAQTRHSAVDLQELLTSLNDAQLVELSHTFYPGIPHSTPLGNEIVESLFSHQPGLGSLGDGARIDRYSFPGQWGTHVDSPVHFVDGLRTLDEIPLSEMIAPLVVVDIHKQSQLDPDYMVKMSDIEAWERENGRIPRSSFVALRTDWSKRWPDAQHFYNYDKAGIGHYPGWSKEVLEFLHTQRNIVAIGHETADTDPGIFGSTGQYPLENYHLQQNKYQIEMLTNLDRVPDSGAVIIATWPRPRSGSGFPARVFAIIPRAKL